MTDLVKAKIKLDRLYSDWRNASANLSNDRNIIAGKIYEQRGVIDDLIDQQARQEYADSWLDRWPV